MWSFVTFFEAQVKFQLDSWSAALIWCTKKRRIGTHFDCLRNLSHRAGSCALLCGVRAFWQHTSFEELTVLFTLLLHHHNIAFSPLLSPARPPPLDTIYTHTHSDEKRSAHRWHFCRIEPIKDRHHRDVRVPRFIECSAANLCVSIFSRPKHRRLASL